MRRRSAARRVHPLTERECLILDRIGRDRTHKDIAAELGVSINTVANLAAKAYRKLGAHGAAAADTRAEPVSALYARRWCHHVGIFPELEEQLATWVPGERSPDRMDALVWAVSALFYPTEEEEELVVYDERVRISPY